MRTSIVIERFKGMVMLATAATLCISSNVHTEPRSSLFDFSAPGEDQQGDYETSAGAGLAGGCGVIVVSDSSWYGEDLAYRIPVEITASSDLADVRFDLILDTAGGFFFDHADVTGMDLVFTDEAGGAVRPWWLQSFSRIEREGSLRLAAGSIPSGSSLWYLYFGGGVQADDVDAVFNYTGGGPYLFAGDMVAAGEAGLIIMSFADGNEISAPGFTGTLGRGETATIPAGSFTAAQEAVSATKPVYAVFDGSTGDAAAPARLSGTLFVLPTPRYEDRFTVISPGSDAVVTISDSTGDLDTFAVPAGASVTRATDITTETVRITSDVPVVVARTAYYDVTPAYYDSVIIPPPATDITGGCAGTCLVSAVEDGTEGVVYMNGRLEESFSLDALGRYTLSAPGSQGDGPAVRIVANKPVMAVTYGDGDGGEMAAYLPTRWLGWEYMIPIDAQYVFATAVQPSTTCSLEYGGAPHEQTSDNIAPPFPKKLYWGSTTNGANIPAPAVLTCDKPVWAIAERTAGDDEVNLWPCIFFRDGQPDMEAGFTGEYETKFSRGAEWITTPDLVPANGVLGWTGFSAGGDTDAPEGTSLLYQVSNDNGLHWYVSESRGEWREAGGPGDGNDPEAVDSGLMFLDVLDGGLKVRVLLSSPGGVLTPRVDEIQVDFDAIGDVSTFQFIGVPGSWYEDLPLQMRLRALDEDRNIVMRFSGPVAVTTDSSDVTIDPETSPEFTGGEVEYPVTFSGSATVMLTATYADAAGIAGPISIISSSDLAASMLKVGGDDQFAVAGSTLAMPVVVRVIDEGGSGIEGVGVTFEVTEGGGYTTPQTAGTDENGLAYMYWTLGAEPGPNRLTAGAGDIEGSPAEFVARGDPETLPDMSGDGGCGCAIVM